MQAQLLVIFTSRMPLMSAISAECTLVGLHISKQIYKTSVQPDFINFCTKCYVDSITLIPYAY